MFIKLSFSVFSYSLHIVCLDEDAEAIVIWPRSKRWQITTRNDTSRMCEYLIKACEEGTPDSEPRQECTKKAKVIIQRAKSNMTQSIATKLMKCIVMIGDKQLAQEFLNSSITANPSKPVDFLLEQMAPLIERFGVDQFKAVFLSTVNAARFVADPVGTANFLIKCCNVPDIKTSNPQLAEGLIEAFVDSMSPRETTDRKTPAKSVDSFPLNSIIGLFADGARSNSAALAKRVIEAYIWLSCCQQIPTHGYSYYSHSRRITAPKGPKLLATASVCLSIVNICEKAEWNEYETVLVDAVEKLCEHGNAESSLELVENIAPVTSSEGATRDRSRICTKMASIACENILAKMKSSESAGENMTSANATKLMKCIVMIRDVELAKRFLSSYIATNANRTPEVLLDQLEPFIKAFGADIIHPIFLTSVDSKHFVADPTSTADFLIKCCTRIKTSNPKLNENLIESFVNSMSPVDGIGLKLRIRAA